MTRLVLFVTCLLMAACNIPEPRFGSAPIVNLEQEKIRSPFGRIEVSEVTLPIYGASEEIHRRDESGAIKPIGALWSDEPGRTVTLQIASDLGEITGRLVAPEPWPFRDLPQVRVDVRVEDFFATNVGTFRLSGQVFVAPEDNGPDRAKQFNIEVGIAEPEDPGSIAVSQRFAVMELSRFIALNGLR